MCLIPHDKQNLTCRAAVLSQCRTIRLLLTKPISFRRIVIHISIQVPMCHGSIFCFEAWSCNYLFFGLPWYRITSNQGTISGSWPLYLSWTPPDLHWHMPLCLNVCGKHREFLDLVNPSSISKLDKQHLNNLLFAQAWISCPHYLYMKYVVEWSSTR